ncbi:MULTISPECIES: YqaJ viral recombinase family protein [Cryobacterium]|nr:MULTISPECIES: YqaJ viral recombinase family protein [Cryobacterium]
MTDQMLSLFDEEQHPSLPGALPALPLTLPPAFPPAVAPHLRRIVADSTDRVAWLRARAQGITATDVAKLATPKSLPNAVYDKVNGSSFSGNTFTDHGRAREPEIAAWVQERYGIEPSTALFHAADHRRHLATPDGVGTGSGTGAGGLELAEIKTTSKAWRSIPRSYLRQVWWQQYVLGAERTLLVWEQHKDFVPMNPEPECKWIERDEEQIAILVGYANDLIALLNQQATRNQ